MQLATIRIVQVSGFVAFRVYFLQQSKLQHRQLQQWTMPISSAENWRGKINKEKFETNKISENCWINIFFFVGIEWIIYFFQDLYDIRELHFFSLVLTCVFSTTWNAGLLYVLFNYSRYINSTLLFKWDFIIAVSHNKLRSLVRTQTLSITFCLFALIIIFSTALQHC